MLQWSDTYKCCIHRNSNTLRFQLIGGGVLQIEHELVLIGALLSWEFHSWFPQNTGNSMQVQCSVDGYACSLRHMTEIQRSLWTAILYAWWWEEITNFQCTIVCVVIPSTPIATVWHCIWITRPDGERMHQFDHWEVHLNPWIGIISCWDPGCNDICNIQIVTHIRL